MSVVTIFLNEIYVLSKNNKNRQIFQTKVRFAFYLST